MLRKKTTYEFIIDAIKVHGDKYDYSLVDYVNNKIKVEIICPIHGVFEQRPSSHVLSESGCAKCANNVRKTTEQFITESKEVHGDKYGYSDSVYITANIDVKIMCPIHGVFEQRPRRHIQGSGCIKCRDDNFKDDKNEFIEKSNIIHNNFFNYSNVVYIKSSLKVEIMCPIHGVFEQRPNSHLNGQGCPICNSSKGEIVIRKYLNDNKIVYVEQKTFDGCVYKKKLRFDFYLTDYNIVIEYNGIQHYKPIDYFGGVDRFKQQQQRDLIKEQYCIKNDIRLIVIKYNEDIEDKIKDILDCNWSKCD